MWRFCLLPGLNQKRTGFMLRDAAVVFQYNFCLLILHEMTTCRTFLTYFTGTFRAMNCVNFDSNLTGDQQQLADCWGFLPVLNFKYSVAKDPISISVLIVYALLVVSTEWYNRKTFSTIFVENEECLDTRIGWRESSKTLDWYPMCECLALLLLSNWRTFDFVNVSVKGR